LHGLDALLSAETGMAIIVAHDPLHSVVMGAGRCLEEFAALKQVLITSNSH
ncbi:MAG: rod shape-determining protein, partial [Actinomycetota bacterium]|nr:rod shape-determining protein [Actinomycetota bacterium]